MDDLKQFVDLIPKYLEEGKGNSKAEPVYPQKLATVKKFFRNLNTDEAKEHVDRDEKLVTFTAYLSSEWLKAKYKTDNEAKITQLITQRKIKERIWSGIQANTVNIAVTIAATLIGSIIWALIGDNFKPPKPKPPVSTLNQTSSDLKDSGASGGYNGNKTHSRNPVSILPKRGDKSQERHASR